VTITCFWLLIPILIFNVAFSRFLPSHFQPRIWGQFPRCLSILENSFRFGVMLCTLFLPCTFPDSTLKMVGLCLFIIGVSMYFCSWFCVIRYPLSAWSRSLAGFSAPSWTPILWFGGIDILSSWSHMKHAVLFQVVYTALIFHFLLLHNFHAFWIYKHHKQTAALF